MSDRDNRIGGYRASLRLEYNVACLFRLVAFQRSVNPRGVPKRSRNAWLRNPMIFPNLHCGGGFTIIIEWTLGLDLVVYLLATVMLITGSDKFGTLISLRLC
jgi:hypothetical protein